MTFQTLHNIKATGIFNTMGRKEEEEAMLCMNEHIIENVNR